MQQKAKGKVESLQAQSEEPEEWQSTGDSWATSEGAWSAQAWKDGDKYQSWKKDGGLKIKHTTCEEKRKVFGTPCRNGKKIISVMV